MSKMGTDVMSKMGTALGLSCAMLALASLVSGCSIFMSARLPLARPPDGIVPGKTQQEIDAVYGHPVAVGMSADGKEYVEQIQFVDGIRMRWKVLRVVAHCLCDDLTIFLWEFIGTPIEMMNADYPEYVYYVVYDEQDRVVRSVAQDSPEGKRLASLPWTSPRLPPQPTNRKATVRRIPVSERSFQKVER